VATDAQSKTRSTAPLGIINSNRAKDVAPRGDAPGTMVKATRGPHQQTNKKPTTTPKPAPTELLNATRQAKVVRKAAPVPALPVGPTISHHSKYDCIFGFSTGHVGTTTLGRGPNYGNIYNAQFIFEGRSNLKGRHEESEAMVGGSFYRPTLLWSVRWHS
jgi:hypothetical protein